MTRTRTLPERPGTPEAEDDAGVYAPQADSLLLADTLRAAPPPPGAEVLDLGTGTGVLALTAAGYGARVTAVDVSGPAVARARRNAALAGLPVRVLRGDLFGPVAGRRFDLILCNPPYVPAPGHALPENGPALAWDAGPDGRAVLDRVCAQAGAHLRPGGTLLLVHSALSGPATTLDRLRRGGLAAEVVRRVRVPLGPVLRSRAAWLRTQGLLPPGDTTEGLVIVRAERAR